MALQKRFISKILSETIFKGTPCSHFVQKAKPKTVKLEVTTPIVISSYRKPYNFSFKKV